jgi:hypothetical protein
LKLQVRQKEKGRFILRNIQNIGKQHKPRPQCTEVTGKVVRHIEREEVGYLN